MKGERKWLKLAKENSLLKVEEKKREKKAAARILNCCMILKASARSWLGIVDTSGTRGRPPAVLATRLELELGG